MLPLFRLKFISWYFIQNTIFRMFFCPNRVRTFLLRLFGARIGKNVKIRANVRVHFPWNLVIGDFSWIGEDAWIINHVLITIGNHVCISQGAKICSSSHNFRSEELSYKHHEIQIGDGAWICLASNILPGSSVGLNSVISAGETFSGKLPNNHIFSKGRIRKISPNS